MLTCEHGGNAVPARWRAVMAAATPLLSTHLGYDLGALALARQLARTRQAPLLAATTTRLLVDLNRSAHNAAVFSRFTRVLPADARARLLGEYHAPHRARVHDAVAEAVARGHRVVHVAVHSFTPVLAGEVRNADVGLLYDPARAGERELAAALRGALRGGPLAWRVRLNYPYRGVSDGLTRWLRGAFAARDYVGIELEVNQGLLGDTARWRALGRRIDAALAAITAPRSSGTRLRRS